MKKVVKLWEKVKKKTEKIVKMKENKVLKLLEKSCILTCINL